MTAEQPRSNPHRTTGPQRFAGHCLLGAAVTLAVFASAGSGSFAAASSADRAAGAALFKDKGCDHCHGANLIGSDNGPALTGVGKRLSKHDIERQIRDGGKEMPPFADVLSDKEIHDLVDYLAHQKKPPNPAPTR